MKRELWEVGWEGNACYWGVGQEGGVCHGGNRFEGITCYWWLGGREAHVARGLGRKVAHFTGGWVGGEQAAKGGTSQIIYDLTALSPGCLGFGLFQPGRIGLGLGHPEYELN